MRNAGLRLVQKNALGPTLACSHAQLCLFTSKRACPHSSNLTSKTTYPIKNLSTQRHISTDRITYLPNSLRHASVCAANNPIKFFWKPGRLLIQPEWDNCSTNTQNLWVSERY